jgi:hypothetical protein
MAVQAQPHAQLTGGAQVGEVLDLQGLDDGARPPEVPRRVVHGEELSRIVLDDVFTGSSM